MMIQTCRTCAYGFQHEETELGVTSYRCHRYAPRDPDQRWPKVDFSEWCGEYAERCEYERAV